MSAIKREFEDVYSFPVFTESFCTRLSAELDHYRQIKQDSGIALRIPQIDSLIKQLVSKLHPLLLKLYPQLASSYEIYPKLVIQSSLIIFSNSLDDLRTFK